MDLKQSLWVMDNDTLKEMRYSALNNVLRTSDGAFTEALAIMDIITAEMIRRGILAA